MALPAWAAEALRGELDAFETDWRPFELRLEMLEHEAQRMLSAAGKQLAGSLWEQLGARTPARSVVSVHSALAHGERRGDGERAADREGQGASALRAQGALGPTPPERQGVGGHM